MSRCQRGGKARSTRADDEHVAYDFVHTYASPKLEECANRSESTLAFFSWVQPNPSKQSFFIDEYRFAYRDRATWSNWPEVGPSSRAKGPCCETIRQSRPVPRKV